MSGGASALGINVSMYDKYTPEFFTQLRTELGTATTVESINNVYESIEHIGRNIFLTLQELKVVFADHIGTENRGGEFSFERAYARYSHIVTDDFIRQHRYSSLLKKFNEILELIHSFPPRPLLGRSLSALGLSSYQTQDEDLSSLITAATQ